MPQLDHSDWSIEPSLSALLEESVRRNGDRPLLTIEDDQSVSYNEFNRKVNRMAAVLKNLNVAKGDLVGVMLPNIMLFPVTLYACLKLGAVMVPINATYRLEDARYVLNFTEIETLVTTADIYGQTIANIRKECPHLRHIILRDDLAVEDERVLFLSALLQEDLPEPERVEIKPTDLATILFTSGTTGYPKGCMHDQTYWLYLARKVVNYATLTEKDCLLNAQPFYYMDPQWNLVATLMSGAHFVLLKRFSPTRFWEHCIKHGVTWCNAILANLLYKTIPADIKERHSFRVVSCTILPPDLQKPLEEKTGVPWRPNFGMTETGCDLMVPIEAVELTGTGCIGKPVWGREARVVDADDVDVPPGEVGEMIFRGKGIMQGYFKNPVATEEAFRGGWFHTGDLVTMDADGWLYFKGRKKDMVRRSGENIASLEIEDTVVSHPKVKEAAVIPVKDEIRGEEVKVYLLLQEGETAATVPPQEIIEFCTSRLAPFKIPRYYEYVEDFPRSPASLKVEKYKLKEAKADLRQDSYDSVDQLWR